MSENPVFKPENALGETLCAMETDELLIIVKKLCKFASEECSINGFRGGFRPGNISYEDNNIAVGPAGFAGEDGWSKDELEFMAPEMFWSGIKTASADVYSIGLILYYGLNGGKLPFIDKFGGDPDDTVNALKARMNGEPVKAPQNADPVLGAIIEKALAFKAENRYADPHALLDALVSYSGEIPEAAEEQELSEVCVESPVDNEISIETPEEEADPVDSSDEYQVTEDADTETEEAVADAEAFVPEKAEPKVIEVEAIYRDMPNTEAPKPLPVKKKPPVGIITVLILICAAIVWLIVALNNRNSVPEIVEKTPAPTTNAVSTPLPTTTLKPEAVSTYQLFAEDISWEQAEANCVEMGGHLVTIDSLEEYNEICALLSETSAEYVWIGCHRDINGELIWTSGEAVEFYNWALNEPSVIDSYDDAAEDFIMLVRQPDGTWMYNDSRIDPMAKYADFYRGKIAYICEITE